MLEYTWCRTLVSGVRNARVRSPECEGVVEVVLSTSHDDLDGLGGGRARSSSSTRKRLEGRSPGGTTGNAIGGIRWVNLALSGVNVGARRKILPSTPRLSK